MGQTPEIGFWYVQKVWKFIYDTYDTCIIKLNSEKIIIVEALLDSK